MRSILGHSRLRLAEAKSQLVQAQAVQLATQADFKRNQELFNKKVISEQEFENKKQLNESNVAKVGALEAAVQTAQLNLGFTKIAAPVDGIAGIAQAQIGDLVGTGGSATTLTTVSKIDPIRLYFPLSEKDYKEHADALKKAMQKPESERSEAIEMLFADGSVYPQKGRFSFVDREWIQRPAPFWLQRIFRIRSIRCDRDNSRKQGL